MFLNHIFYNEYKITTMKKSAKFLFACLCILCNTIAFGQNGNSSVSVSDPVLVFANKSGGNISKNELWNSDTLKFANNIAPALHVCEFKMTTECDGKLATLVNDRDEYLTDEMRTAIYYTEPGCKIYFEYIKARFGRNKDTRSVKPVEFTVTE